MSELKELYTILKQMVKSAIANDKDSVLALNKSYEALFPKVYHRPLSQLDLDYDNCRQSCVFSVTQPQRDAYLNDAIDRFSKIPEPEE